MCIRDSTFVGQPLGSGRTLSDYLDLKPDLSPEVATSALDYALSDFALEAAVLDELVSEWASTSHPGQLQAAGHPNAGKQYEDGRTLSDYPQEQLEAPAADRLDPRADAWRPLPIVGAVEDTFDLD
eukprot:10844430-Lingulodinium_polyedra.AAC.1